MKPRRNTFRPPLILAACVVAAIASCARKEKPLPSPFDHTYPAWSRVLAHCATADGFRYDLLASARAGDLERQIGELQAVSSRAYKAFTREERLAFLINGHNIFAVRRVMNAYPVKSIEQTETLGSALRARDIRLAGRKWSLASLRAKIMGKEFYEARAIFALNWCAKGCATIAPVPVTPFNLGAMLDRQAQGFVRDPDHCRLDRKENVYHASPLLKEYRKDIERDFTTLWKFIERYATGDDALKISKLPPKLKWIDFDPSLNDSVELLDDAAKP